MSPVYVAMFSLPIHKSEHLKIEDAIRAHAGSRNYRKFFLSPGALCFIFSSHKLPWEISFDKVLLERRQRFHH